MSYLRFADNCDVYMYHHVSGFIECCACALHDGHCVQLATRTDAIKHLESHREAGHKVPRYATERLIKELASVGEYITKSEDRAIIQQKLQPDSTASPVAG